MARLSIIIPAYNAQEYLNGCIESVLAQTYSDWELIIVNDGSKDNTASICDAAAEKDERIKIVHQNNSGVSAARNSGLDVATGELIAYLDADDALNPEAYTKLVSLIDEHGVSTSACAHLLTYTDATPSCYEAPPVPAGIYNAEETRARISVPLLQDRLSPNPLNGYVWRYVFSAEIIRRNSIRFVGKYLEDELFLIEYFACGASLAVTDSALYSYLQNAGSVTKKYLPAFSATFLASLLKKERLVSTYNIPVAEYWRENTCWAGILIAVSNEFARGSEGAIGEKVKQITAICRIPEFAKAIETYNAAEISGNKSFVAAFIKRRAYLPLALAYKAKNLIGDRK